VDNYQLDLICFKTIPGSIDKQQDHDNFVKQKTQLQTEVESTFEFLNKSIQELFNWLLNVKQIEMLSNEQQCSSVVQIITNVSNYLESLEQDMQKYEDKVIQFLAHYDAQSEFFLNKVQKAIVDRVSDYICLIKAVYNQVFDELILLFPKDNKKVQKKDVINQINHQMMNLQRTYSKMAQDFYLRNQTLKNADDGEEKEQSTKTKNLSEMQDSIKSQNFKSNKTIVDNDDKDNLNASSHSENDQQKITSHLMSFEERLKKNATIKALMKMSASIPNGFDMDCTKVDENDFSTIICQAMLSNDYIYGLKEQKYMNIDQKLEKIAHCFHGKSLFKNDPMRKSTSKKNGESSLSGKLTFGKLNEAIHNKVNSEDFYVIKGEQNVLNSEVSMKDIETELLRLDQYHFNIQFSNYKHPSSHELGLIKDSVKRNIKIDRVVI
jgi:hypothetical protein